MKKLLVFCLFVCSFSALAVFNNPVGSSAMDSTGTIKTYEYQSIFVRNTSGAAASRGQVMVLDTTQDDGMSMTDTCTQTQVPICVLESSVADDGFSLCQTYGYADYVLFDAVTTATAGQRGYMSACLSAAQGAKGKVEMVTRATAAAAGYGSIGVFLDASSATGAIEMFIQPE